MICHGALVRGEIDLYPEYTGTGLAAILKLPVIRDPEEAFRRVAAGYQEKFETEWLQPFGFNNTYAMSVRAADAERRGWETISDLIDAALTLRAGFTAEFAERPDGYPGLTRVYGLQFGEVCDLDPAIMYEAIAGGEVDVICAFATDGRIAAYSLQPLLDDRCFFPPYHAAPVVRSAVLRAYPELRDALGPLTGLLDDATMLRLNFQVDGQKRSPAEVAREFLEMRGLVRKRVSSSQPLRSS